MKTKIILLAALFLGLGSGFSQTEEEINDCRTKLSIFHEFVNHHLVMKN